MESTPMKRLTTMLPKSRTAVLTIVFVLLALPALGSLYAAASFHLRNRNTSSIVSSGELREYVLYVPPTYDPSRPAPLVISMHGAGGWPVQQMELSRWNRLADRERFLVVYPAGRSRFRVWHVNPKGRPERDVRFISDLIDEIGGRYEIDRDRIYANGFSNGGAMTFVLSCTLQGRELVELLRIGGPPELPNQDLIDRLPAVEPLTGLITDHPHDDVLLSVVPPHSEPGWPRTSSAETHSKCGF
jgi:hypothetical protein